MCFPTPVPCITVGGLMLRSARQRLLCVSIVEHMLPGDVAFCLSAVPPVSLPISLLPFSASAHFDQLSICLVNS